MYYVCDIKIANVDKELFISVIESIREQTSRDNCVSISLSQALGCDVPVYDNSILLNMLKRIILSSFPSANHKEVLSEIDHYCYFLNFGRIESDDEVLIETPGDLYERLVTDYV